MTERREEEPKAARRAYTLSDARNPNRIPLTPQVGNPKLEKGHLRIQINSLTPVPPRGSKHRRPRIKHRRAAHRNTPTIRGDAWLALLPFPMSHGILLVDRRNGGKTLKDHPDAPTASPVAPVIASMEECIRMLLSTPSFLRWPKLGLHCLVLFPYTLDCEFRLQRQMITGKVVVRESGDSAQIVQIYVPKDASDL